MDGASIEIRDSNFGKGLFAKKDIEPGTVLCKAKGKKLNFEEIVLLKEKESHTLQIDFDKYIMCEAPFLYSNHSCNPNCAVSSKLELLHWKKLKRARNCFGIIQHQCLNAIGQ